MLLWDVLPWSEPMDELEGGVLWSDDPMFELELLVVPWSVELMDELDLSPDVAELVALCSAAMATPSASPAIMPTASKTTNSPLFIFCYLLCLMS
jgi:hypothetical protein